MALRIASPISVESASSDDQGGAGGNAPNGAGAVAIDQLHSRGAHPTTASTSACGDHHLATVPGSTDSGM